MTAEALAIHFIDNLDAKLMAFLELFENANLGPGDSRLGEHSYILDVRPYFPQQLNYRSSGAIERPATKNSDSESPHSGKETGELPF